MLHHLLNRPLESAPDRPILESRGAWTTAAELERMTARLASGLAAAGLEEGDRVALVLPNGLEAVACFLACFRMKLVVVSLDDEFHPLQIGYALGHSGAAMLIVSQACLRGLDEARVLEGVSRVIVVGDEPTAGGRRSFESLLGVERTLPSDVAENDCPTVMISTSGMTSRPKGVVLSYGALSTGVQKYLARVTLTADDVALIVSPISQPLALRGQLLPTLWVGGRVSLLEHFSFAGYVEALRRPPAKTFLTLTPAALGQIMATADFRGCDFSGLRICLSGGDRVPPPALRDVRAGDRCRTHRAVQFDGDGSVCDEPSIRRQKGRVDRPARARRAGRGGGRAWRGCAGRDGRRHQGQWSGDHGRLLERNSVDPQGP